MDSYSEMVEQALISPHPQVAYADSFSQHEHDEVPSEIPTV